MPHALNIVNVAYVRNLFDIQGHSSVHHLTAADELPSYNSHILILLVQLIFLLRFHLVCSLSAQGGEKETGD